MEITEQKQIDNAIKWLEALLSGKYKQTKGKLGNLKKGFCCWGLGCYLTHIPYNHEDSWNYEFGYKIGWWQPDGLGGAISNKNFGLAIMNDGLGWSFQDIAKYLIQNPINFLPHVAEAIKKHFANESDDNGSQAEN